MVDDSSDDIGGNGSRDRQIDAMSRSVVEALGGDFAQVRLKISDSMRASLAELGYADADIDLLDPKRAVAIIEKQQPSSRRSQKKPKSKYDRFEIMFDCNVCGGPNMHSISRKAYQKGTVIVTCPGCNSTHLIADNLKWIEDDFKNIEEAMAERGLDVQRIVKDGTGATAASSAFALTELQDEGLEGESGHDDESNHDDRDAPSVKARLDGITEDQALRIREAMREYKRKKRNQD